MKHGWIKIFLPESRLAHTDNEKVLSICGTVISLCERVAKGNEPEESEWATAWAEGWAIEDAAENWTEIGAACAAGWAADTATEDWAFEAAEAAKTGAVAKTGISVAAGAMKRTLAAAKAKAWDRMNTAILDAIEAEIKETE